MPEQGISTATEAALRALAKAGGRDFERCPRCRCCEVEVEECSDGGGQGVWGHDGGEDCCPGLHPEDNIPGDPCLGRGYWQECMGRGDGEGKHRCRNVATGRVEQVEGSDG